MKSLKDSEIEKMVTDADKITNADLAAALEMRKKEQAERNQKRLLGQMDTIQSIVDSAVTNLRNARDVEKKAKKRLTIIANAQAQFFIDGDAAAFDKAIAVRF